MAETQNIEYKSTWRDDFLEQVCGLANAQGGKVYIGVEDDGTVIGVKNSKRLMDELPNKMTTNLGIITEINLLNDGEKEYIEIVVNPSNAPISYRGKYYYRSGATNQELKGNALQEFILKKFGRSWDELPNEYARIEDIDRSVVDYFIRHAVKAGRIDSETENESTETILRNLGLILPDGSLTNAAVLLFGSNPQRLFPGLDFRIGRFGADETDLLFQDSISGNLLQMTDKVIRCLRANYLVSPISYEGLSRIEKLEIPENALRELVFNAIVHKQYPGYHIQMKVYADHIDLWNNGEIYDGASIEEIIQEHASHVRNKAIANIFYRAGFIEVWGRGIRKVMSAFEDAGLEKPIFQSFQKGFLVRIIRPKVGERTENGQKTDKKRTRNGQENIQEQIIQLIRTNAYITQKEMLDILQIGRTKLTTTLRVMQQENIIRRVGATKNGYWKVIE